MAEISIEMYLYHCINLSKGIHYSGHSKYHHFINGVYCADCGGGGGGGDDGAAGVDVCVCFFLLVG